MVIKPREKSHLLRSLEILNSRMDLTEDEKRYYLSQAKGYQGEKQNDLWVEKLPEDIFVLHDLLFEIRNTQFQIDTLIITQNQLYLLDVKNNEGDYIYKNDGFYTLSGNETKNHLHQLKRCESLLRQLLQTHGYNFPIESYLIFNNPEFFLYNVPPELPIVFPTQLKRFYQKLNKRPSKLSEKHKVLANKLLAKVKGDSCYSNPPNYEYDELQKGIVCVSCQSLQTTVVKKNIICLECGYLEKFEDAVLRSVEEYKLLFPERKVRTMAIYEWCGEVVSDKVIRTILHKNYKLNGLGRFSYFK